MLFQSCVGCLTGDRLSPGLPEKMKALVFVEPGKVDWVEKAVPICGPRDAILRPLVVGLCGCDPDTVWRGALGDCRNLTLGHEAIGEVMEIGDCVKTLKVGDKVIVPTITPDWGSREAQDGFAMHSGGMLNGWKLGNTKDGTFAEYFHINEADSNLAILPSDMNPETAILLSDMIPTGCFAAEIANITLGDTVAIIGTGPVGLSCIMGACLRGASFIYSVGSRPKGIELATIMGATHVINYKQDPLFEEIILQLNQGPVDRVLIAGGGSDSIDRAIKMVKAGGYVGNVNFIPSDSDKISINREAFGVGMSHKYIHAGLMSGGKSRILKILSLIQYNRINPDIMITHRFHGFNGIEQALNLLYQKPSDLIKAIVTIQYNQNGTSKEIQEISKENIIN
eukprot:Protomagalhaensia_sp_Gyna_25__1781@NODE_1939_length_1399_cov_151_858824_g1598_i0_p1_GENE_NODE_1939_length_1399_cov_151_858824_g1598_i0NODE_1939_length_1399_cov_151_858824_g1598_i0_p1_ORF_typecomplete_len396_score59_54ADH_zinc_N/PF00107_26/7_5e15ADH_N/PF08240_12/2_9e13ADH_N/PF08240_12/7e03Glu_dehyd_C/PF16912_5/4_1e09AlaDh_PNT_C/PF01262_21/0_023Pyr_redox_2/PF07992_14/0_24Pyr_redox_2/PF07992_14/2_5e02Aminotran_3/PF00202_21/0_21_NODE_1939_length_1399_cov_151_858824_g1598_i01451332